MFSFFTELEMEALNDAPSAGRIEMKLKVIALRRHSCRSVAFHYDVEGKSIDLISIDKQGAVSTAKGKNWGEEDNVLSLASLEGFRLGMAMRTATGRTKSPEKENDNSNIDLSEYDPLALFLGYPLVSWTPGSAMPMEQYDCPDGGTGYYATYAGEPRVHVVVKNGGALSFFFKTRRCSTVVLPLYRDGYFIASDARLGCSSERTLYPGVSKVLPLSNRDCRHHVFLDMGKECQESFSMKCDSIPSRLCGGSDNKLFFSSLDNKIASLDILDQRDRSCTRIYSTQGNSSPVTAIERNSFILTGHRRGVCIYDSRNLSGGMPLFWYHVKDGLYDVAMDDSWIYCATDFGVRCFSYNNA